MRPPLLIDAMEGLGDAIYQRPFVRWHAGRREVFLRTSWPDLFEDIQGVRFVEPEGHGLRTQGKNAAKRDTSFWVEPPEGIATLTPRYRMAVPGEGIVDELRREYAIPTGLRASLDLPDFGVPPVTAEGYAVVRPVTHRKDWLNTARSADPAYIARTAELLRAAGYWVVAVADLESERNQEWMEEPAPVSDEAYLHGELDVRRLLALIQHASVVVGGVGWIVPAVMAAQTPAVFIAGGQGRYNAPDVVVGDDGHDRIRWLVPDHYCRDCRDRLHSCDKGIEGFDARFMAALAEAADPAGVVA